MMAGYWVDMDEANRERRAFGLNKCCDRCNAEQIPAVLGGVSCWDENCDCHQNRGTVAALAAEREDRGARLPSLAVGESPAQHNEVPRCGSCDCAIESWWSYCAMCGYHIARGALVIATLALAAVVAAPTAA